MLPNAQRQAFSHECEIIAGVPDALDDIERWLETDGFDLLPQEQQEE